ncbi:MAG: hypothetical protein ACR2GY_05020 [Phycisphaerales bacterium]
MAQHNDESDQLNDADADTPASPRDPIPFAADDDHDNDDFGNAAPMRPVHPSAQVNKPMPVPDDELWEPVLLQGEGVTECPRCKAPMPQEEQIVCLRCGFNLVDNQEIRTQTGVQELDPEVEPEPPKPITRPGLGGLNLPAILAGVATLLMTVAFLAGARGLYSAELLLIPFGTRVGGLFSYYLWTITLALGAYAGLFITGKLEERPIGDTILALIRMVAIACLCQLFLIVPEPFGSALLEFFIEFSLRAVAFILLAQLFFALSLRDAATVGVVALLLQAGVALLTTTVAAAF